MAEDGGSIKEVISTPELFCAWRPGRKNSGEPWNTDIFASYNLRSMTHNLFFFDFHVIVFTRSSQVWMKTLASRRKFPKNRLAREK